MKAWLYGPGFFTFGDDLIAWQLNAHLDTDREMLNSQGRHTILISNIGVFLEKAILISEIPILNISK